MLRRFPAFRPHFAGDDIRSETDHDVSQDVVTVVSEIRAFMKVVNGWQYRDKDGRTIRAHGDLSLGREYKGYKT